MSLELVATGFAGDEATPSTGYPFPAFEPEEASDELIYQLVSELQRSLDRALSVRKHPSKIQAHLDECDRWLRQAITAIATRSTVNPYWYKHLALLGSIAVKIAKAYVYADPGNDKKTLADAVGQLGAAIAQVEKVLIPLVEQDEQSPESRRV